MAGGFTPSVHLFSQSRGKLAWDADLQAYLPGQSAEAERSAGACRGRFALDEALSDGIDAGRAAARAAGFSPQTQTAGPSAFVLHRNGGGGSIGAAPGAGGKPRGKAFVGWPNDVPTKTNSPD